MGFGDRIIQVIRLFFVQINHSYVLLKTYKVLIIVLKGILDLCASHAIILVKFGKKDMVRMDICFVLIARIPSINQLCM